MLTNELLRMRNGYFSLCQVNEFTETSKISQLYFEFLTAIIVHDIQRSNNETFNFSSDSAAVTQCNGCR